MALEPKTFSAGMDESNPELDDMLSRLKVSAALTLPLLVIAMAGMWLQLSLGWLEFVLASPVVLWGGLPLFERGWHSIRHRSPNMLTLIAMGTGAAYFYSLYALLAVHHSHLYFESAAVITTLVLLGQVLELRARSRTTTAIKSLLALTPKTARLVLNGRERDVPLEAVRARDRLRTRPGEKVASMGAWWRDRPQSMNRCSPANLFQGKRPPGAASMPAL